MSQVLPSIDNDRHRSVDSRHWQLALLALILAIALGSRLWRLEAIPAGLSHDEAYDALNAVEILDGRRPVFFASNNGREALFMYLVALSFQAFGVGPFQLRLVSALAGVAAVGLTYLLAKRLFDRQVALLAAALLAVSFWPIFESRLGLRASLLPALAALAAYGLWRWLDGEQQGRSVPALGWAALAGLGFGLALHTYTAARFAPLLALGFAGYLGATGALPWRRALVGFAVTLGLAAAIGAPLAAYFATHPGSFAGRTAQVNDLRFILQEGNFWPLVEDTLNTLAMFSFRGDPFMRYNLAGRPVFDPLSSILFYAGLAALGARFPVSGFRFLVPDGNQKPQARNRKPAAALVLVWLGVGLLPSATTGESPHFLRAIGAQPAVYILAALGFIMLSRSLQGMLLTVSPLTGRGVAWITRVAKRHEKARTGGLPSTCRTLSLSRLSRRFALFRGPNVPPLPPSGRGAGGEGAPPVPPLPPSGSGAGGEGARSLAAAVLVILTAALAARDYFVVWHQDPEARRIYGAATARAAELLAEPPSGRVFLAAEYPADLDRFVLDVLRSGRPVSASWFDGRRSLVFPASGPATYFFPRHAGPPAEIRRRYFPEAQAPDATDLWSASRADPPVPAPTRHAAARLGDFLELLGYDLPAAAPVGGVLRVVMYWRVLSRPPEEISFFAHLIGATGSLWSQMDGLGYPLDQWQAGDLLVEWHDIPVPVGAPPVDYQVEAGAYERASGRRVVVRGEQGSDDRLRLGSVRVTRSDAATQLRVATPVGADLGGVLRLLGYDLSAQSPAPGDRLRLTLYWESLAPTPADYTVFSHLAGEDARPRAQGDGPPAFGAYPTSAWRPGDVVRDVHDLALPADLEPGRYWLLTGLYVAPVGQRLAPTGPAPPILAKLVPWLERRTFYRAGPRIDGDHVVLTAIDVQGHRR
ncbi:MAG: glycosyltransferase family 39 protein [Chloroflexi bacterium]|nr:glycosyltransferase family 39 protein [Chloroflexota bacterium]